MKKIKLIEKALLASYGILWIGGVIHYAIPGPSWPKARWGSILLLSLATAIILLALNEIQRRRLLLCGLVGLASEIIGVRYGFPYGQYIYSDQFSPLLFGVPWTMGCAWMILFAYVKCMIGMREGGILSGSIIGAAWMVGIDLVIEPLAAGPLGYWKWLEAGLYYGVPWTNFAGWYGTSLVLFLLFKEPWPRENRVIGVGVSIVLFFTLIGAAKGLWGATLVGLGLCVVHYFMVRCGRPVHAPARSAF